MEDDLRDPPTHTHTHTHTEMDADMQARDE